MRWVLFVPLLVLLALFALSNTQPVEVRLWPLDVVWVASLGIAMLLFGGASFLLGALLVWAAGLPGRRRAARIERAARQIETELATHREKEAQARRDADLGRAAEPDPSSTRAIGSPR